MAGSSSKQKGNRGENEICKAMTAVFGGNWQRSFFSGAFVGGKNAHRKQIMESDVIRTVKGDIIPPSTMPKLVIESKNYKDFKFHQLLQNTPNTNLESWIEQEELTCDEDDFLIIVFKITRLGTFIMIEKDDNYVVGNYSIYNCKHNNKVYIITEFMSFITDNKDLIEQKSA